MSSLSPQVLKSIERMGLYDPLIIKLNNRMFWSENHYAICCRSTAKIDENYIVKYPEQQNPNSQLYDKRCILYSKVKYVHIKL